MKKILSTALALMTCLMLTIPVLTAQADAAYYNYVVDPWTGTYAPYDGTNYTYWNGDSYVVSVAVPTTPTYQYVAPSANGVWVSINRGMGNFQRSQTYTSGTYTDVPSGAWYENGVKTLYEMNLAGTGSAQFHPDDTLTLGEVVSLAVRINCVYNGWGVPEGMSNLQYALNMGIVTPGQYSNYDSIATRRSFAAIMAKALPTEAIQALNTVPDNSIPDVPSTDAGAWGIYTLYRAGVLVGCDGWGTFYPNEHITRASAAAITARLVDASQRKGVYLTTVAQPVTGQPVVVTNPGVTTGSTSKISLNRTSLSMYPRQQVTLNARVSASAGGSRTVRWTSSNPNVASVDVNGRITAHRAGTTRITASLASGAAVSCYVDVSGYNYNPHYHDGYYHDGYYHSGYYYDGHYHYSHIDVSDYYKLIPLVRDAILD